VEIIIKAIYIGFEHSISMEIEEKYLEFIFHNLNTTKNIYGSK